MHVDVAHGESQQDIWIINRNNIHEPKDQMELILKNIVTAKISDTVYKITKISLCCGLTCITEK